jgi:hypothetical protein
MPTWLSHMPFLVNLIIDTGSSNTWVGAKTLYVKTSNLLVTIMLMPRLEFIGVTLVLPLLMCSHLL